MADNLEFLNIAAACVEFTDSHTCAARRLDVPILINDFIFTRRQTCRLVLSL